MLGGKVFEVSADTPIAAGQIMLSERQGENGTILRIASDSVPADGEEVMPNLEDAFLYIFRGERK